MQLKFNVCMIVDNFSDVYLKVLSFVVTNLKSVDGNGATVQR